MPNNILRNIPSVNELLESPPLRRLVDRVNHNAVVGGVRDFLDNLRNEVQSAKADIKLPAPGELAERIAEWILREEETTLRPVINATGILLHTGLGRAPLPAAALQAVVDVGRGYASLEVDLQTGERSHRTRATERLLKQLTGAEAAIVVNNNAAATMISLAAIAAHHNVIVSRGQLIEIGGSYRLPEVMSVSGAILREVGTTNKTRIGDYEAAIDDQTAALMRVHTSNYVVCGFTEEASLDELVALGRSRNIPVIDDIGSGAILDLQQFGITGEPLASDSIRAGTDLVLFSGDKLLGGPQCGIIVGRRPLIEKIMKHPLMRALRVDKLTLAALAATLKLYQEFNSAIQQVPFLSLLTTPIDNLRHRAERLVPQLTALDAIQSAEAVEDHTYLGGGSVPTQEIPTWCVAVVPKQRSLDAFSTALRVGNPPVFARIHKERLFFDLRSVLPQQDMQLVAAVESLGLAAEDDKVTG